jgi:hypothetical protein
MQSRQYSAIKSDSAMFMSFFLFNGALGHNILAQSKASFLSLDRWK